MDEYTFTLTLTATGPDAKAVADTLFSTLDEAKLADALNAANPSDDVVFHDDSVKYSDPQIAVMPAV